MAMKDWECKHCGHLTYLHSHSHRTGGRCGAIKGRRPYKSKKEPGHAGDLCKCPGYQPRKKNLHL